MLWICYGSDGHIYIYIVFKLAFIYWQHLGNKQNQQIEYFCVRYGTQVKPYIPMTIWAQISKHKEC